MRKESFPPKVIHSPRQILACRVCFFPLFQRKEAQINMQKPCIKKRSEHIGYTSVLGSGLRHHPQ